MKIIVDADACPRTVLAFIRQKQALLDYGLLTVSSFNHAHGDPGHLFVGDEDQAADIAIINRSERGDIVVTQDWGLAAMAIGRGAAAISPDGRVFTWQNMDFLLEERHLKAKFRRGGGRTRGPSARTKEDDQRFEKAFLDLARNTKCEVSGERREP